jgi:hypothetical protein
MMLERVFCTKGVRLEFRDHRRPEEMARGYSPLII